MKNQVLAILQARMSSSRLPGKVMKQVNGKPIIYWQIRRISKAMRIDNLVVVTSKDQSDNVLASYLEHEGIAVHRGSLDNVFSRFFEVVEKYRPQSIVRLTGDCPILMPKTIDQIIEEGMRTKSDYLSNTLIPTFPDGLDVEYVSTKSISILGAMKLSDYEKEHVTVGIYSRADKFKVENFEHFQDLSSLRWTLDTIEDLKFFQFLFSRFSGAEEDFDLDDVLKLRDHFPDAFISKLRTSLVFPIDQGRL